MLFSLCHAGKFVFDCVFNLGCLFGSFLGVSGVVVGSDISRHVSLALRVVGRDGDQPLEKHQVVTVSYQSATFLRSIEHIRRDSDAVP